MSAEAKDPSEVLELEDRDPQNLSRHLQVSWDDIIGEPLTIRSPEIAWSVSNQCFRMSRNCCYICLSVFCAPIIAICLGFTFACLSFEHIWCTTPCLRICKISCSATRVFVNILSQAIVMPITTALGYFWSSIKVKQINLTHDHEKIEDALLLI